MFYATCILVLLQFANTLQNPVGKEIAQDESSSSGNTNILQNIQNSVKLDQGPAKQFTGIIQNMQSAVTGGSGGESGSPISGVMKGMSGAVGGNEIIQNMQNAVTGGSGGESGSPISGVMKGMSGAMGGNGIIQNMQNAVTGGSGGESGSPVSGVMKGVVDTMGGGKGSPVPMPDMQQMGQMMQMTGGAMQLIGAMQGGDAGKSTEGFGNAISTVTGAMKG